MEVTLTKKDETLGSLTVILKEEDYQESVNQKIKDYGKKVQIKGFRPGKVPFGLVKQMVGENILAEEVFSLLNSKVSSYIKENDLSIIGDPLPSAEASNIDFKADKEFTFTYDLGLVPEFSCDVNGRLKFKNYSISVDDKAIDEADENIKKQNATTEEVDSVEDMDVLTGQLKAEGSEESKESLIATGKIIEKQKKAFAGKKVGDTITFDIRKTFADDFEIGYVLGIKEEEAADVKGKYEYTISKITRQVSPELNQELFDKVFGPEAVKSEEEYREKIKEVLAENYVKDADAYLFYEIKEKLLDKTKLDVSPEFLKRWLVESNQGNIKQEDVDKDYDKYEREVKWSLIKNKLAKDNDIKVEEAEIKERAISVLASQYFGGMEVPEELKENLAQFADKYLQENNGNNYYNIYEQVIGDKLFDFFKSKVGLNDTEISLDDFKKLVEKK